MLKRLKTIRLLHLRQIHPALLLTGIIVAELLVLGWLTWLIFHHYPISDI